ncbi:hypothetical protein LQE94_10160 [Mediterraneibacter sp. NSJ-151]|uniref:hypothetical protein n=1 Tax=Mediterraneibacter sp. NSJ-151 TaxID=2897708 RepID=UPI001F0AB558|nr:hypothetical protein [Mediterraneibacter sp. NSJ-151]MCH4280378.1 hypothetical protein [Mediterraneibacter sp. NSJ-151]
MNESKNVKALKKQLAAAIAMVCVAAVALGSSTYAWFVTNNKVTATTSTISAQSNAAFMKIKYNATATTSDLTADVATINSEALYPAQWANNFDNTGKKTGTEGVGNLVYQFETAYGTKPTADGYTMDPTSLKSVGTPTVAANADYAIANVFNISSKGTDLANLKVSGAQIQSARPDGDTTKNDQGNTNLDNALRVLVVCGNNWVVCDKTGAILDSEGRTKGQENVGLFGATDKSNTQTVTHDADTLVTVYVYYDGNDSQIYSNNLPNLNAASSRITVTFTADAQNS